VDSYRHDLDEACALVNDLAPEHLEIIARETEAIAARVRHAGAIFLCEQTPEAVGDYFAGGEIRCVLYDEYLLLSGLLCAHHRKVVGAKR
jgi:histidinol dehydrogenase